MDLLRLFQKVKKRKIMFSFLSLFGLSVVSLAIALATPDVVTAKAHLQLAYSTIGEAIIPERKQQQSLIRDYEIWEPAKIPQTLREWEKKYPDLIRVTTAQEAYGLPTAGNEEDCPFDEGKGCLNYFFTIQDYIAHPIDSDSSSYLPEIFLSGALHGNERVGPTSVMEASNLLLESAFCEGLPRGSASSPDLKEAENCRKDLLDKGIDDVQRKWLARLVSTRRIVVAPTANALGYYQNTRTEGRNDPNRDFPYDLEDTSLCMRTIAGRTVNEIFREHLFQLALTFHGGMEVVAYEWGAPTWYNHLSPDDEAQKQIGAAYSLYGGGWSKSAPYKYGTMNDEVYYVRGGMEDWAYAGSWTDNLVKPCTPKEFGGYPAEKTIYNGSTLRVFNMLVETSNKKIPTSNLGSSMDVLSRDTAGNGHISRNIRLSLLAVDMVEPYVAIMGVNQLALTDDIVPMAKREARSCVETKAVMLARNSKSVDIEWTVGGALTIDSTSLWYAKWDDVSDEVNCWDQPHSTDNIKRAGDSFNGTGFFSAKGSWPHSEESVTGIKITDGPLFRATIPLKGYKKGDKILVMASARVDQSWTNIPADNKPKVPPQSHIVQARTDPNYHSESSGKHIQGRTDWFSVPITVVIGDLEESIGKRGDDSVNVIEIHPRLGESMSNKGEVKQKSAQTSEPKSSQIDQMWFPVSFWQYLVGVLLIVSFLIVCIRCRKPRSTIKLGQKNSFIGDGDLEFEGSKYSDRVDDEYGDEEQSDDGIEIPIIS